MWGREDPSAPGGGYRTPPATWNMKKRVYTEMPMSERKRTCSIEKQEPFHMIHKVPSGDSPYGRAKHAQLVSKDPERAISLFWAAINAGDRVDSALKDLAVVMKQLNRSDEGIEAIKSFRYLCPFESQDSIDNLLLELYKKSGRIQEEAELLEHKLKTLEHGGIITIAKKSHGKQINLTIEQERARILGNLAWVHLQLHNYGISEQYYRNALSLEPDNNKLCNLAICLMRMDRIQEAKSLLEDVRQSLGKTQWTVEPFYKSFERATEMLAERERVSEADHPGEIIISSSSDNFSSNCSFASWVAGTVPEQGIMYSFDSVKSPVLITQPRECKWVDEEEEVDHRVGQVTFGAARRLKFGNTLDEQKKNSKSVESAESNTWTSKVKKMCADSEKGYQRNASGSSSA
ncbi:Protein POLLENLESS 3-LIKE 1 [Raphanus sativus]|uniref:Protein POLLENLESS 3-LIKE 1 n=1 Tax=Raphanus sativus TaxID=3726 RepID=A0A6J0NGE8_RAPSA|nr:protein POLLENLESS 3-LIKE 1 [Raphanus sativus]KAJ4901681.1 Protein POLLENLESS 3-LIKE 1 [Raphanus sativus]